MGAGVTGCGPEVDRRLAEAWRLLVNPLTFLSMSDFPCSACSAFLMPNATLTHTHTHTHTHPRSEPNKTKRDGPRVLDLKHLLHVGVF